MYYLSTYPLRNVNLLSQEQIKARISSISEDFRAISLDRNELYKKTSTELVKILPHVPRHVVMLDYMWNELYLKPSHELKRIFSATPKHVKAIHLASNKLFKKTNAALAEALSGIPEHVIELDLGTNDLEKKSGLGLENALSVVPKHIKKLILSGQNYFKGKTAEQWAKVLKNMPPNITELSLRYSYLSENTVEELKTLLAAIPPTVTSIDLTGNGLYEVGARLGEILGSFPLTVTSVNLCSNYFNYMSSDDFATALTELSKGITSLNLSFNGLGYLSGEALAKIFAAIPEHVYSINLEENNFNEIPIQGLANALQSLPKSIKAIDLSSVGIDFNKIELENALPHIETVTLNWDRVQHWSPEQGQKFHRIVPKVKRIVLLDRDGSNIYDGRNPVKVRNIVNQKGLVMPVPSLLSQSLFKVGELARNNLIAQEKLAELPQGLKNYLQL